MAAAREGGSRGRWDRVMARAVVGLIWGSTALIIIVLGLAASTSHRSNRSRIAGSFEGMDPFFGNGPSRVVQSGEKRAAIIVDDLGTDLKAAAGFLELDLPLTVAVLPYRRYSHEVARRARLRGKEVLLHLPLEPRGYPHVDPGAGALLVGMDRETAQAELSQQIDSLPGCVGVSTHMGSLFTEEPGPMHWVLSVLAERELLFVDSRTTPNSVAGRLARELGIPFVARSLFLDGEGTEGSIIHRLCALVDLAVRDGQAVGIVHPSAEAVAALPKVVAAFREKGVHLVPVSRVVSQSRPGDVTAGRTDRLPPDSEVRVR